MKYNGLLTYRKEKKIDDKFKLCALITIVSFVWIAFVIFFSPWKGAHYYRAIFPVLTVGLMSLLFLPKIRIYYPLLFLYPAFLFWVSCLNIDKHKEYKDNTPIIFTGEQDYYEQFFIHELFNEDRRIGFSKDRANLEQKLEQLGNNAAVAIRLEDDFSKYITSTPTANMDNFYKYVDTTRYEVVGRQFHRSFNTIFLLNRRDSTLINNELM